MLTRMTALMIACSALMFHCADPQREDTQEIQEIIDNLVQTGLPASDTIVIDGVVYAGRDAAVSLTASREMLEGYDSTTKEQYRGPNLISRSLATICINGSAFTSLGAKFSQALDLAITNYNELGLTFRMQRTSGSTTGCNAVITARVTTGTGGSSGLPSGGLPFNTINIGSGLNSSSFGIDTVEHVITHELGHTVGLLHSDVFSPSISCGSGAGLCDGFGSCLHIDGTPTGATLGGSVMNTCFRTVETGEFTSTDIIALQILY